jgi:hypothetical protein
MVRLEVSANPAVRGQVRNYALAALKKRQAAPALWSLWLMACFPVILHQSASWVLSCAEVAMRFDRTTMVLVFLLLAELLPAGSSAEDAAPWAAAPDVWPVQAESSPGVVSALALSSEDKILAIGLDSGDVVLMSADDGKVIRRWLAHAERINGLVFTAENHRLITASDDQTLKSWNLESGAEEQTFSGATSWVTSVGATPDGKRIAAGSYDRMVRVWDVQTNSPAPLVFTAHQGGVKGVDFSSDGKRLVSAGADRTAIVWNLETKQPMLTLKGHGGAVRAAKFSPDGAQIATAG